MTLLVIGAAGYVGGEVRRRALALGVPVVATYHSRRPDDDPDGSGSPARWRQLDIRDAGAVDALVRAVRPTAIVSCAYAGARFLGPIDRALNWSVNALGAVHVARAAAETGARLVHASSDAVHRGSPEPLTEAVMPDPVYPYGAAKAAAELGVTLALPSAALARLSLVASDGGPPARREVFMRDLAAGTASGVLFTDDVRCPIAVTDAAAALVELALGADGGGSAETGTFAGVLNLAGTDAMSYHDMGVLVARRHGLDPGRLPAAGAADGGRPGEVRLDTGLAARVLRTRLRGLREVWAVPPQV